MQNKKYKETKKLKSEQQDQSSKEKKYSFDEIYKTVVHLLLNGTEEDRKKVWKQLNEGKGDWVWIKMKVITDAYNASDAKAKEKFSLIGVKKHLQSGYITQIEDFQDEETGIKYRQYKRPHNLIWRIPYATEEMSKYTYDKALDKRFLGDYIELHTVGGDDITFIPLDTPEKVKDFNNGGGYYLNHPLYKNSPVYELVPSKNKHNRKKSNKK